MKRKCFECKFYDMGYGECLRYPPVHVTYQITRYDSYNNLVTEPQLFVEYPKLDPDHRSCGEFEEDITLG